MLQSDTDRKIRDIRLAELVKYCMISGALDLNLYQEYDVKRGLRESDGKGVLTGLTEISDVVAFKIRERREGAAAWRAVLSGLQRDGPKRGIRETEI